MIVVGREDWKDVAGLLRKSQFHVILLQIASFFPWHWWYGTHNIWPLYFKTLNYKFVLKNLQCVAMALNEIYCDGLFSIYTNIKLLYSTPKTNIMLYVNYILIENN